MIARLFLLGKWLFISVVSLLVLASVTVSVLVYSSFGLNFILWSAEKFEPGLSIDSSEGRLGDTFSLHGISYLDKSANIDLKVNDVTLSLNASRLFQPAIVLDNLAVSGLSVKLTLPQSSTESNDSTQTSMSDISSPLPIEIKLAQLNDIHLVIDDMSAHWNTLSTGLAWRGSKLTLSPTQWQGIIVNLPPADKTSQQPPKTKQEPFRYTGLNLPDIVLPLAVNIPQFTAKDIRIVQGEQTHKIDSVELGISGKKSKVVVSQLNLQMPEVHSSLQGEATLSGNYPLSLAAHAEYLTAPIKGQIIDLSAKGSLADLSLSLVAQGAVKTETQVDLSLTQPDLPFKLSAQNTHGYWPVEGKEQYRFNVSTLTAAGNLNNYQFAMDADVKGEGIADTTSNLQGKGTLTSVSLDKFVVLALEGEISGQLTANWENDISIFSQLSLKNVKPQAFAKDIPGVLNGEVIASAGINQNNGWNVDVSTLDIDGDIKGYPLTVKGLLTANSTDKGIGVEVSTPNLVVAHGPNNITLNGALADTWNLDAAINVSDLSKSLTQTSGQISGDIHLTGDQITPRADIALRGTKVKWQDTFTANQLALTGDVVSLSNPKVNLNLEAKSGSVQEQKFDSVLLQVDGGIAQHNLSLAVVAPKMNGNLLLDGGLDNDFSVWNGKLTQVELIHNHEKLQLLDPVLLKADITNQNASIEPHCWGLDDASLCLVNQASVSAQNIHAAVALKSLSLSKLTRWIPDHPVTAQGTVNGTASVEWMKGQDAQVEGKFDVSKGQMNTKGNQGITIGWDTAVLTSKLHDGNLSGDAKVNLTDNGQLELNASVPDVRTENKQVQGNIKLSQINIDFLQPLLGEYSKAGALINSDIALSGDLLHPKAQGEIKVTDLLASGEMFPVEVQHGDVLVSLAGYQAKLTALINTPDGDLNIDGNADWADLSRWRVNSHVFADGLNVDLPPMVKIKVVPDITLSMNPDAAMVEGKIKLPWGRIKVEKLPESAIEVSSDQVLVDQNWDPIEQKSLPFRVATNVEVDIGNDFLLQAFGLKGYLDGILKISQKENAPFVVGDVNITDGTYRSFGQDLIIQQGKVMMNGSVSKPYVDITAIRNPDNIEDDVTAGIKVSGPADNPSVTVFSDPTMAQANALSYLLRGQDLTIDSSGSDNNAMTTALIGLSLSQSGYIVGELGQAIGVQDLQLDTSGSGDESQVNVSGYVLPGLQVKYGVGIFNSVGEFTVRYRLMRNLYIEAVSGLTSAVDLLYQFEFD